jgi:hypothetical protein
MTYTPWVAGQRVTAGDIDSKIVQETMAWTALSSVGAYASGFSAGGPTPRMRKLMVAGIEEWEFEGRINISSLTANTNVIAFTFNTGFRVTTERGFQLVGSNTGFYGVRCTFESNGQLMVGVPTAAGASTSGVLLDGISITNPFA